MLHVTLEDTCQQWEVQLGCGKSVPGFCIGVSYQGLVDDKLEQGNTVVLHEDVG